MLAKLIRVEFRIGNFKYAEYPSALKDCQIEICFDSQREERQFAFEELTLPQKRLMAKHTRKKFAVFVLSSG